MTPAAYTTAICLYASAVTVWVTFERWRLSRITESPFFQFVGVLFSLCFALQAACFAVGASAALQVLGG